MSGCRVPTPCCTTRFTESDISGCELAHTRAARRDARALEAAGDPLLLATDLADRLVEGGVPFRQAHEIVGGLVARARELNIPLDQLDSSEFLNASPVLTPEIVKSTFQLESALAARKTIGAPSPENISRELSRWRSLLG